MVEPEPDLPVAPATGRRIAGLAFPALGVLAAEPGVCSGMRGFIVVELLIDDTYRGQGYGRHMSTLLANALPGDDLFLIGTIHRHNTAAYHAALSAGRIDVGGEIVIPL